MVSLKAFLRDVLILPPSIFDKLSKSGIADDLQECTTFSTPEEWKEVLYDRHEIVAAKKLSRLSELIAKCSVEEVSSIQTLEEFNKKFNKLIVGKSSKKRKHDDHDDQQSHKHRKRRGRLTLDDVVAPDESEKIGPLSPPPAYMAFARGTLKIDNTGSIRFDGKWGERPELFKTDSVSAISFWLNSAMSTPESNQSKSLSVGTFNLIDSSHYKGSFNVEVSDKKFDTYEDSQIVLKFRKNNLGGVNIYGKGRNDLGFFELSGMLVVGKSGQTPGLVELYRTYVKGPRRHLSAEGMHNSSAEIPQQYDIGTPVRKFFRAEDGARKPFVGYVIDVYADEIDEQATKVTQHTILYEDGDSEDLRAEQMATIVENACDHDICSLNRKDLEAWEVMVKGGADRKDQSVQEDSEPWAGQHDESRKDQTGAQQPNQRSQLPNIQVGQLQQQHQLQQRNHPEQDEHHGSHRQSPGEAQTAAANRATHEMASQNLPSELNPMSVTDSKLIVKIIVTHLKTRNQDLYRRALLILQNGNNSFPCGSAVKYETILRHLRTLVGEEVWRSVLVQYSQWREQKVQRAQTTEMPPYFPSGQSSGQDQQHRILPNSDQRNHSMQQIHGLAAGLRDQATSSINQSHFQLSGQDQRYRMPPNSDRHNHAMQQIHGLAAGMRDQARSSYKISQSHLRAAPSIRHTDPDRSRHGTGNGQNYDYSGSIRQQINASITSRASADANNHYIDNGHLGGTVNDYHGNESRQRPQDYNMTERNPLEDQYNWDKHETSAASDPPRNGIPTRGGQIVNSNQTNENSRRAEAAVADRKVDSDSDSDDELENKFKKLIGHS